MIVDLNNLKWQLKGYWPNVPFLGKSMEIGNTLLGVTEWMDATVPGGVHMDLLKAGYIEEPEYELNSIKNEWVENRWWMYRTEFEGNSNWLGKNLKLVFKGVDYKAHFYLNDEKLGEHQGMFESVEFNISNRVNINHKNELLILLENAPVEMGQIGFTSKTKTQKSRFNYKWDFSTRMVNIGIWDDVHIKVDTGVVFQDVFIKTGLERENGYIKINSKVMAECESDNITVKGVISYDGLSVSAFEKEIPNKKLNKKIILGTPKLWYPNGMGEQKLYKVVLQLFSEGVLSDEIVYLTGIRSLEYKQNELSDTETLPYTFVVNGKPLYIKGVNLVPFDLMYGNVIKETYEQYIYMLKAANINMVRVWGGGIIEKDYFYHLCDLNGILVWQEFIQSSSGVDNIPSEDKDFLNLLKKTATQAVKNKRNNVCHAVWSGGNELTDSAGRPVSYGNRNIQMLQRIVKKYDPYKLFLPTSASGPNEFLNVDQLGANHDVHGSWKYEGIEKHYTVFNKSDSLFHSEFGVDGMSNIGSLSKFLSEKNLIVTNMKDNLVWRHHGEWWDTLKRDTEIFGQITDLVLFAKCSQFIQAEGLRYALEANRRRKFNNSGSIIWQFNEPWPNVSNTCVVDYYRDPKMAFYWMKKAYEPIHVSLKYNRLYCVKDEEFVADVYLHNSMENRKFIVFCEILDIEGNIIWSKKMEQLAEGNKCVKLQQIKQRIPKTKKGLFFVRLSVVDDSSKVHSNNIYLFSQKVEQIFSELLEVDGGAIETTKVKGGYLIKNSGREVCCFVHGLSLGNTSTMFFENNYETLFPGETCFYECKFDGEDEINVNKLIWGWLNKK